MKWFEWEARRVVAIAPLIVAVVAASLPTAPAAQSAASARAVAAAVAPTVATVEGIGPARAVAPAAIAAWVRVEGAALSAVGQLLAGDESCSSAVVGSSSGRLAVTAAHCVYVPAATERMPDVAEGRDRGWVDEMVFVPARPGYDAPHEVWAVERMWVDRAWQANAAPEVDVAFLELRDMPAGTAQEVLGAPAIRFDDTAGEERPGSGKSGPGPTVDVLGYPTAAPFDGTRLRSCEQVPTDQGFAGLLEARCGLARGASGGPWVVPDRGWWSVVAVTSYLSWERPGMLGGVRLGAVAERLWRTADEAAGQR